jgi:hypothetical protein
MIDWAILSPMFLAAVVEWAGAVVTVLAVGPGERRPDAGNPLPRQGVNRDRRWA